MITDKIINQIFGYYDQLISGLSIGTQALISLALIIFLVWQIYMFVKSGHWLFLALILFLSPGTWPAARKLGELIWLVIKYLLVRAQGIMT